MTKHLALLHGGAHLLRGHRLAQDRSTRHAVVIKHEIEELLIRGVAGHDRNDPILQSLEVLDLRARRYDQKSVHCLKDRDRTPVPR
jgi:hypothetical protein